MGVIYYVSCKDCQVTRDLDKFYNNGKDVGTRADAIELCQNIDLFNAALLVSFMSKHKGHNCVFFNEHQEEIFGYKKDTDFWSEDEIADDSL